jgi:hypothetical protein
MSCQLWSIQQSMYRAACNVVSVVIHPAYVSFSVVSVVIHPANVPWVSCQLWSIQRMYCAASCHFWSFHRVVRSGQLRNCKPESFCLRCDTFGDRYVSMCVWLTRLEQWALWRTLIFQRFSSRNRRSLISNIVFEQWHRIVLVQRQYAQQVRPEWWSILRKDLSVKAGLLFSETLSL